MLSLYSNISTCFISTPSPVMAIPRSPPPPSDNLCVCGLRLQVRSVRHTGSTSLLEDWRMLYQLGHEAVDTAAGRAGITHTHTHTHTPAQESSQYAIHFFPTAGAHSPRSYRYVILYTAAGTHVAVQALPALPAANTYLPGGGGGSQGIATV